MFQTRLVETSVEFLTTHTQLAKGLLASLTIKVRRNPGEHSVLSITFYVRRLRAAKWW